MGDVTLRTRFGGAAALAAGRDGGAPVVALEPEFDFTSDAFRALHAASSSTAFQHPDWLHAFYRHLAPARDATELIVTVREDDRLVAVLPLIRRVMTGVSLVEATDLGVSDYAAPILARNWIPGADLPARIASAMPAFDVMRIRPVREEHLGQWQALLSGDVMQLDFSAHATELAGGFPEWRAGALASNFASQLDRKKKRFFKNPGARLELLTDAGQIGDAIRAIQLLRAGRFEGDPIQQDFVRDFYAGVASKDDGHGLARTYLLSLDDEALGYVFGLAWNGRFHYLLIGCDYDRHGRHSPGLLMYDGIIEDWMRSGGEIFDFTIGDEAFKAEFGTTPTRMFALTRTPTLRGRLALAAFNARAMLRRRKDRAAS